MKAFVVDKITDDKFICDVRDIAKPKCEKDEIIIKATYSCLNYKDALSSIGHPGVSRNFPHITGVDVAGTVFESNSSIFKVGERVIVTGYDLGMNSDGGHSEYVKVKASWVARIPDSISDKDIMIYGTAGLTAALSINELISNDITPESGDILVTGATGGVGSIAVSILNKLGYNVVALSGKEEKANYLKSIGANEVIFRNEFLENIKKPLLKEKYAGVVDTVGGDILAQALKQVKYDGVVTCCGLTASYELNTNVYPFILRGVRLIGIDSVECKLSKKQLIWEKLASSWKIDNLKEITTEITLNEIKEVCQKLLSGEVTGRYIVKIES
ncbi:YhdH/YhfP family quinone oxidoreductase [Aliarcobacter butzleri]|uniref:YhdH/YhfP family quinone oxidoreductase n=1 Tax=Aliarcobacter butzleri TaxID=28197 RepID=UPI0001F15415|nr:YhdH/YhfP family quinone oxidoreductase [Aliarcobacter butzleri]EFU70854.1 alcohol dehydrogenase [Aliarcobacter butzleri JV22]MBF7065651.1 acryloyl-CoA reductase [Aliarcobacter butzleri]MCG3664968.1 YhdH/YhfP family quinone oxidoreductase [Aliarcobacter butzleri]MCG3692316.1 YhdH/YhfP family quinone oxidoreductase [Aliarcobacter butzleri]MCT7566576.1 YhdH/YhfP family quinone oxidoreductase [Aliarcobacter butzleri]